MGQKSGYRKDIDGLRAVAVIGVLLFHAKLGWLPGGFVGVDVFFVISGYLITGIIVAHEGDIGRFLAHFYERRIRRLIPPAIPVLAFTGLGAWYLLPPAALEEFAKSVIAYAAFVSNWFFLSIEGYFDGPSEMKPLLHTWSLSIEEQFYLLFPIPILLLKGRGIGAVRTLLMGVFVLSLGLSVYLVQTGQSDAAFYNSLARFWEIALGGLLAVNVVRAPQSPALRQFAGTAGLLMIAVSMSLYSDSLPFPGLSALVPTVGAALVILGGDSLANRLLATRPFVAVGLISYALYLWHWPIFVLIQYAIIGAGPEHFALGIVASATLATASFWAIEKPARARSFHPSKALVFGSFAAVTAVTFAVGGTGWGMAGAPGRFPLAQEYATNLVSQQYATAETRLRSVCWLAEEPLAPALDRCIKARAPGENILLVGDSHAAHFYPALLETLPNAQISLIASDSCMTNIVLRDRCQEIVDWLDGIPASGPQFDRVVISSRILHENVAHELAERAKRLAESTSVTVLGPMQFYLPDLTTLYPTMVSTFSRADMDEAFDEAVRPEPFAIDQYFKDAFAGSKVEYISVLDLTCPEGPQSCWHLDDDGLPITIDATHLTLGAAKSVVARFAAELSSPPAD